MRTGDTQEAVNCPICGTGFDCFLAARQVGETGHIIGVDMTYERLQQARDLLNALQQALSFGWARIEIADRAEIADAGPLTAIMPADRITGRCLSKRSGRTTLAKPVSSPIVRNRTPFAEPGLWRTRTRPAVVSRRPSRAAQASQTFRARP